MEKKPVSHFMAGTIIAAIMIVYSLILTFADLMQNQALGFISYVFLIGGLIYFILQRAKSTGNTATFGTLFTYGFKTTAITTLIVLAFQFVFFLVFPEYKEKMIEIARENALKQPSANADQVEMGMEMYRKSFYLWTLGIGMFFLLIVGLIASLIGAGVAKKNPQPFQNPL